MNNKGIRGGLKRNEWVWEVLRTSLISESGRFLCRDTVHIGVEDSCLCDFLRSALRSRDGCLSSFEFEDVVLEHRSELLIAEALVKFRSVRTDMLIGMEFLFLELRLTSTLCFDFTFGLRKLRGFFIGNSNTCASLSLTELLHWLWPFTEIGRGNQREGLRRRKHHWVCCLATKFKESQHAFGLID